MEIVLNWIKDNWFSLTFIAGIVGVAWKAAPDVKSTLEVVNTIPKTILELQNNMKDIREDIKEVKETQGRLCDDCAEAEKKRLEGAERTELILLASKASLDAIHDGKVNGNVSGALEKLNEYMRRKASL